MIWWQPTYLTRILNKWVRGGSPYAAKVVYHQYACWVHLRHIDSSNRLDEPTNNWREPDSQMVIPLTKLGLEHMYFYMNMNMHIHTYIYIYIYVYVHKIYVQIGIYAHLPMTTRE